MKSNIMQCDDQRLKRLLAADDHDIEHDPWMQHVEQCSQCQARLRELAADDDDWRKAAAVLASEDDEVPCFGRGHETPPSWNEAMARQMLEPPSHPEMLGRLGRYEIERMIGSGGMGIVFKAFDTELNRVVAVKLLAPYLATRGSARKRFAREARAAAGVRDDHVVPIFNVESEHEPPFLVMQYVAGGSLQEKLDRDGPLEVAEVLRIGLQTAKGLAAAHAQGLIHRDVKPSNILLDEGVERALLTDFGLARAEDDACLTRSGFHPGTPHYMSPEQVRGEAIDGRSDLFGLACVLYALCTGHSPFRADTSYAVMRRITDEAPRPIREINADTPEWLERIVMKLLSKSRDDRFDSAEQVAELLEGCLAHVQEPTTTPLPVGIRALAASNMDPARNRLKARLQRTPPIGKLIAAAAFAFFLLAGAIIFLETGKGTIRIETNSESDVPIVIRQGDDVVAHLTVSKDGATLRLKVGNYVIEVEEEETDFVINGNEVSLKRGETWLAKVELQEEPMAAIPQYRDEIVHNNRQGSINQPVPMTFEHGVLDFPRRGSINQPVPMTFSPGHEPNLPPYISRILASRKTSYFIEEIVDQFNRRMAATESDYPQPPLTVDELLCCCRWLLETDDDLPPQTRQMLTDIGIGRWLPEQWDIEGGGCSFASTDGSTFAYLIQFVNRNSGSKVVVRKRYIATTTPSQTPTSPQTDIGAIPLAAAVTEFNAIHKSVDGQRQPPLTVSEVLAAIVDANSHRGDFAIDNATFAGVQQIARTHQLPAGCKLEVLPSFGSQSGDRFNIWSVRIVMPQAAKPGWTHAFEIRKQYVSVDSPNDSKIHWGKPNAAGLQAGFRLIPSQRIYQGAQQIETEFFYRSISGDPISATLPNVFSHHELISKDAAGKLLDVVEVKERTIGGAVQTEIGDQPVRRAGRSLHLGYITPDPEFDLYENQPAETFLTIHDGQKVFLQYIVSDLDGGTLPTGRLAIDIAGRTDNAEPEADADNGSRASTRSPFHTPEALRRVQDFPRRSQK